MKTNFCPKDIIAAAEERFSTKVFDPNQKVSEENLNTILEVARLTPSSCGIEPWKVIDVQSHALRNKILPFSPGAQRGQMNASNFFVVIVAKHPFYSEEKGILKKILMENLKLEADYAAGLASFLAHMYDSRPEEARECSFLDFSIQQAHLLAMNVCSTAIMLGIDSCIIGGFDRAKYDQILGDQEGLYDTEMWSVGICVAVGYRGAEAGHVKYRKPMSEFYTKI